VAKSIGKAGDEVVAAILGCDRLMSDFLSDVAESEIRKLWARSRFPDEVVRLALLEKDLASLEMCSRIIQTFQRSCANKAIAAGGIQPGGLQPSGAVRGAPGPVPQDRSRLTNLEQHARAGRWRPG
jgi:hypothetical protein